MIHPLFILYTSVLLAFNRYAPTQTDALVLTAPQVTQPTTLPVAVPLKTGAAQTELYLPLLQGKRVGLVVNQTSTIGSTHLADTLLSHGIKIVSIFAPEHGFRGDADAGAHIKNGKDPKTGLPIISLYGSNVKPTPAQMKDLDIVVFDVQDVGTRFYTYSSTMHYAMEAAAENNKQILVLDRPNPNGHYVDGPVLEPALKSFVGLNPIPIVHGLTLGEMALMINGEKWLKDGQQATLTVIPVANYTHQTAYTLPVIPSPNLPNMQAIILYPSLCLFEGTNVSVGRGTPTPFQVIGSPFYTSKSFSFTPQSMPGATNPPHKGQVCFGQNLTQPDALQPFTLAFLLDMYQHSSQKEKFFNTFFEKLAGTAQLREQVIAGKSEAEIRASWEPALSTYKDMRKKYLLYLDTE